MVMVTRIERHRRTCHASCGAPLSQHLAWHRNTDLLSGRMRLVSVSAISRCIVSYDDDGDGRGGSGHGGGGGGSGGGYDGGL